MIELPENEMACTGVMIAIDIALTTLGEDKGTAARALKNIDVRLGRSSSPELRKGMLIVHRHIERLVLAPGDQG